MHRSWISSILFRRGLALLITAGVCATLTWFILVSDKDASLISEETMGDAIRPVTVIYVRPGTYQTNIEAYGEVVPQWKVAIKSKVKGQILEISERFRKGNTLKKGEPLLEVEQSDYRVQLTESMLALKEARTKLLVEKKEGQDALAAWTRSGIKSEPSPLLLREPYLEMARADLEAAEERVKQAKLFMDYTRIKAPFDALVVERYVSMGGTVFASDEVGVLYGMKTFVIALHIGKKEWEKLPITWKGMDVRLIDEGAGHNWTGRLAREGQLFEADSRLRTLFVEIDKPLQQSPPLLPGNFVQAQIPGRSVSNLLRVPDSARTQQGLVWYVDERNLLRSKKVEPLFREKGYLYFNSSKDKGVRVVINPNNSFVNGLKVTPVIMEK